MREPIGYQGPPLPLDSPFLGLLCALPCGLCCKRCYWGMSLHYLSFARVLLVLVVYDGFALLQAGVVRPCDIGHDIAWEFLLFEVIAILWYMLMQVLISLVCLLITLTF
ncbi:hypothetical protein M758_UG242500 [Ceratodon purpureus]|nr:hypothetical protein M758_UG242500 [Ceratodon purpureus]